MRGEKWFKYGIIEEAEFKDLEKFQPIQAVKNEKVFGGEKTKSVAKWQSTRKPVIYTEIRLYVQGNQE